MGMFATGQDQTPGPITIKGGLISATGGSGAAGIGGGFNQRRRGLHQRNPTVIATRGSDGAQDIGSGEGGPETLIKDQSGKTLSYIRWKSNTRQRSAPAGQKSWWMAIPIFSNKDGLMGFFVPLRPSR
jgi:hypothetical protein